MAERRPWSHRCRAIDTWEDRLSEIMFAEPVRRAMQAAPWYDQARRAALSELLARLAAEGYDFVAPTPATQRRVLARPGWSEGRTLRDLLGWSLPVASGLLAPDMEAALVAAGAVSVAADGTLRPQLRASRVEDVLFWHSAYPTTAEDSVFLGPDSHRFAGWILARMDSGARTILDYGAGAGVGGIIAARRARSAHLTIADLNPKALFLASINAERAGVAHDVARVERPSDLAGPFDLIVTHPPFMIDAQARAYRDGGDLYGARLSLDWMVQGVDLLAPGGRLILHTGVSIVDGRDVLRAALEPALPAQGVALTYRELDTDIFGEDLSEPGYRAVERIAAIGTVLERTG